MGRKQRTTALFDPIKTMCRMTDRVLVGVSTGKDSAVTLDLCCQYFKHVTGYFMHTVPGLGFQERILKYYEKRYGIEIIRLPHFMLSEFYRYGVFRPMDLDVPTVSTLEAYNYLREKTGIWWIAGGERMADSRIRYAMIHESSSIDDGRGKFYPVAYWNKKDIVDYIRIKKLKLGEDSYKLGFSFGEFNPKEIKVVKDYFPAEYERIKYFFPFIEATFKHYDYNPDFFKDQRKVKNERGESQQIPAV